MFASIPTCCSHCPYLPTVNGHSISSIPILIKVHSRSTSVSVQPPPSNPSPKSSPKLIIRTILEISAMGFAKNCLRIGSFTSLSTLKILKSPRYWWETRTSPPSSQQISSSLCRCQPQLLTKNCSCASTSTMQSDAVTPAYSNSPKMPILQLKRHSFINL